MRKEIRIYLEGGGNGPAGKAALRSGFGEFLGELKNLARERCVRWEIVACGSRSSAFKRFRIALKEYPSAFIVLLVDAEAPVRLTSPWQHLRARHADQWDSPGVDDQHCHLMVQMMEAWLIADREKLREYYGRGFHEKSLPANANVELVDKDVLERSLNAATRSTRKGPYHKLHHGPEILERIRADVVRNKAPYCARLLDTLKAEVERA